MRAESIREEIIRCSFRDRNTRASKSLLPETTQCALSKANSHLLSREDEPVSINVQTSYHTSNPISSQVLLSRQHAIFKERQMNCSTDQQNLGLFLQSLKTALMEVKRLLGKSKLSTTTTSPSIRPFNILMQGDCQAFFCNLQQIKTWAKVRIPCLLHRRKN